MIFARDFVTIVSGVPRSGTSLVMQMLGAGGLPLRVDDRRPADPDNPRGYFEYDPVRRSARDIAWLADAAGQAVKVVHALLRHLPEGPELRVVLVERDLREVLASQRRMIERVGGAAPPADDARLVQVFAAQLREARAWAVERPRTALLRVQHRELLDAPGEPAARIDAFLGGELDLGAMASCVDPALYRSRRLVRVRNI